MSEQGIRNKKPVGEDRQLVRELKRIMIQNNFKKSAGDRMDVPRKPVRPASRSRTPAWPVGREGR